MSEPNGQKFLKFLFELERQSQKTSESPFYLFLMGDIFDLWISDHEYFIHAFKPIIEQLKVLQLKSFEIHYFEGNHDLYLKEFWQDQMQFIVHTDPTYFQFGSTKLRLEHGDQMNPKDYGYRFLRFFLRSFFMKWFARHLPESWIHWIGTRASQASRDYTSNSKQLAAQSIQKYIAEYIVKESAKLDAQDSFDVFVAGHVHILDDQNVAVLTADGVKKSVRAFNLGAWFDQAHVLVLSDQKTQLVAVEDVVMVP